MRFPALTQSQQPTRTHSTRYTTQQPHHSSTTHNHTHRRHPATSVSSSHGVRRTTTRIQPRQCCFLLSHTHNHSNQRQCKPLAHNATAAALPLTASATTANTITLTHDIQRRQCRVHTQCATQRLASSVADVVACSYTITATHDNATLGTAAIAVHSVNNTTHIAQTQSHSHLTSSDVSVEFTRSVPLNDSHPASPILLAEPQQPQQPGNTTIHSFSSHQRKHNHTHWR
jgi:hypothetical protein